MPITFSPVANFGDQPLNILHFLWLCIFSTGRNSVNSTTVPSSVRLVALLLQHEAAMTSFRGTMAHLTHFGLLHNREKSFLKELEQFHDPLFSRDISSILQLKGTIHNGR